MSEGGSSRYGAAVNLAKVSIGVGVLTLPYSVSKGGLAFAPLLIAIIAYWNAIVCSMMIICKNRCKDFLFPSGISSTYSAIAYVGMAVCYTRYTTSLMCLIYHLYYPLYNIPYTLYHIPPILSLILYTSHTIPHTIYLP